MRRRGGREVKHGEGEVAVEGEGDGEESERKADTVILEMTVIDDDQRWLQ